jgi:hypothetical protein
MTLLRATVTGNLTQALDQEVRRVSASLKRAAETIPNADPAAIVYTQQEPQP